MKILLSAYCCAPNSSSEQGFGWRWVTQCAQRHDVTVITCLAQKGSIEAFLQDNPININFEYVPGPAKVSAAGTHYRFERIRQILWQLRAIPVVRRLQQTEGFDIAQHVTTGSWRQPSCLAFSSIPYIFGPTSGSETIPPGFLRSIGLKGALWELFRSVSIELARWDPLVQRTLRRAAKILVVGPATYSEFKEKYPDKTLASTRAYRKVEAVGISANPRYGAERTGPLRISWLGRLIPRKGLDILLHALADPCLSDCIVDVIGSGPSKDKYLRLATRLGVSDQVNFLGHIEQLKAFEALSASDLFVFTSLQDMMGQAISEAMQLGLPCVVLDWSGPAWLVGNDGAYKVRVSTYAETCRNLASAINEIKKDEQLRCDLAGRALDRIESITNVAKQNAEIDALYESVRRAGSKVS